MKMFAFPEETRREGKDDKRVIHQGTKSEIQGFPPNAQNQTIYEIVADIQQEENRREEKRRLK